MTIIPDSHWRDLGDLSYQTWQVVIDGAGGPEGLIRPETWEEARPHTALCLSMLRMESSYGTDFDANPAVNHNPLNLKIPAGGGYVTFPTWAAGIAGWRDRITNDLYKGGVYAETVTVRDLIHVFAPTSENATEHYIAVIVDLMNGWLPGWKPKETEPMPTTTWQGYFDRMFGTGWRISQDWAAYGGPDLYEYGAGHGLDGSQHTGIDVAIPYGTRIFAPYAGSVVCAGTGNGLGFKGTGCGAFNDYGDGASTVQGVGRIEIQYPYNHSLIFGHSRTVTVTPGQAVVAGQQLGTSGGMYGAHIHLEARWWDGSKYVLFNPRLLIAKFTEWDTATPTPAPEPETEITPMALDIKQATSWSGPNRPGIKLNAEPLWITFHDTGNPATAADSTMHKNFVLGGGGKFNVSFHFTVDDTGLCWQMLPLDEIGYHAADGCDSRADDEGCFASVAIEMCVNRDNWKSYGFVKDLMAAIISGDPRINYGSRSHKDFSVDRIWTHRMASAEAYANGIGKYCPAWALNNSVWPGDTLEGVKARLGQVEPLPELPMYAKPQPVPLGTQLINDRLFLGVTETYTVKRQVTPRLWAEATSPATGPDLMPGANVTTSHVVKDVGIESDLTLVLADGSRIAGSSLV